MTNFEHNSRYGLRVLIVAIAKSIVNMKLSAPMLIMILKKFNVFLNEFLPSKTKFYFLLLLFYNIIKILLINFILSIKKIYSSHNPITITEIKIINLISKFDFILDLVNFASNSILHPYKNKIVTFQKAYLNNQQLDLLIKNLQYFLNDPKILIISNTSIKQDYFCDFPKLSFLILKNSNMEDYSLSEKNILLQMPYLDEMRRKGFINSTKKHKVTIAASIYFYNEVDIIVQTARNILSKVDQLFLIDNWSTDGSWEKVNDELALQPMVKLSRFPSIRSDKFQLRYIQLYKEVLLNNSGADWLIHLDADEIMTSPFIDLSFRETLSLIDSQGYKYVESGLINIDSIKTNWIEDFDKFENLNKMKFSYSKHAPHANLIRIWKRLESISGSFLSGGHSPIVNDRSSIFPITFPIFHYPSRSQQQLENKIMKDRLTRLDKVELDMGWHWHYSSPKYYDSDSFDIRGVDREIFLNSSNFA